VKITPKLGASIDYKETEIKRHMDDLGYFVLLSNDVKEPRAAIDNENYMSALALLYLTRYNFPGA
jgi:hypothetical protein